MPVLVLWCERARAEAALARSLENIRLACRGGLDHDTASWMVERAYRRRDARLAELLWAAGPANFWPARTGSRAS